MIPRSSWALFLGGLMSLMLISSPPTNYLTLSLGEGGGVGGLTFEMSFLSLSLLLFSMFIGTNVIFFSSYYLEGDSQLLKFQALLLFFLMLMFSIFLSENLFSMFLGWEGVGFMSFLLIGWYSSREEAILSSKKAVIYNRFADFFFFLLLIEEGTSSFLSPSGDGGELGESSSLLRMFLLLAFLGKSAQLVFHPWLTSAMEGPTPVSALLHSSTMVVAGVFCVIKFSSNLQEMGPSLLLVGSCITNLVTSSAALVFKDQKKIIALSTTSQLSFMIFLSLAISPLLGLLHMTAHGFFKALLFLTSGGIIHQSLDNQDYRRTSGGSSTQSKKILFLLASLGLLGIPFIGAFFSKHIFLSSFSWGPLGSWSYFLLFFLTLLLSTSYSIRLIWSLNKSLSWSGGGSSSMGGGEMAFLTSTHSLLLLIFIFGGILSPLYISHFEDLGVSSLPPFFLSLILGGGTMLHVALPKSSTFWMSYSFSPHLTEILFWELGSKMAKDTLEWVEKSLLWGGSASGPLQALALGGGGAKNILLGSFLNLILLGLAFFCLPHLIF